KNVRAFTVSGKMKPEEAVVATLSSLPDEVVGTVGTVLPSEDSVSERKRKLEFIEMQEELIKEEEKEEKAKLDEQEASKEDLALKEMTEPTAREEEELKKSKEHEKNGHLCEISKALAVLASASSVTKEREEFLSLVNKEIELYNTMLEKEGTVDEEEARRAYRVAREESDHAAELVAGGKVSSALIEKVDAMLQKLEKEIDDVDARIGNRWQVLDRDRDGKVTPEEVEAAAGYLKDTMGKEGVQELISNLSKDREGNILVEDIKKMALQTEENSKPEETAR
uniref:EF-hand domain-containing protein n=1 Tax=Aegilops tauschii subsp. strangulata TaxID=200361 RepID=A0A453CB82_AEGTS